MKFRRKSAETEPDAGPEVDEVTPEPGPTAGPYDIDDLPDDGVARMDLGSMLIAPAGAGFGAGRSAGVITFRPSAPPGWSSSKMAPVRRRISSIAISRGNAPTIPMLPRW